MFEQLETNLQMPFCEAASAVCLLYFAPFAALNCKSVDLEEEKYLATTLFCSFTTDTLSIVFISVLTFDFRIESEIDDLVT